MNCSEDEMTSKSINLPKLNESLKSFGIVKHMTFMLKEKQKKNINVTKHEVKLKKP